MTQERESEAWLSRFRPAAALDLTDDAVRQGLLRALGQVREAKPGGAGTVATVEAVETALVRAWRAFEQWRYSAVEERVELLLRVAERMRSRRFELAATVLHETGKIWREADGEVAESIDFLEYHALAYRSLLARAEAAVLPHPWERNAYRYLPLGAGVLLPPWPFPIAQLTAMASAAIVTGNTVVVKPASHAPRTSGLVVELWREAGAPAGVIDVLYGAGSKVGAALVNHPRTRFVTLTGESKTGRAVAAVLGDASAARGWFPRLTMELGGKNPVVVDETADLESTAAAVVEGVFGFSGQKCSAGSRLIVVKQVHDELVARIVKRAQALVVGDPSNFDTDLGPLIDNAAAERMRVCVDVARNEGVVVCGGGPTSDGPRYALPTVVTGIGPGASVAREEILAPFLTVTSVNDVAHALELANDSPFGLTGAFFSTNEMNIERAVREMQVGSLYLNRKTTASEVGFHPFGGFGLSGTDAKAGGPDYLLNYVQPQVVTRPGPVRVREA